jgi:hypothetical protein
VLRARLTHNAVISFHRALCPSGSLNAAYVQLRRECETAQHSERAPSWLRGAHPNNDGYLLLDGGNAALALRDGRAVTCLINPQGRLVAHRQ